MTEADWLSSSDPERMLSFVCGDRTGLLDNINPSDRKLRLFACACCRAHAGRAFSGDDYYAVLTYACDVAEQAADGLRNLPPWRSSVINLTRPNDETAFVVHDPNALNAASAILSRENKEALRSEADLLREIVGNPHRPVNNCVLLPGMTRMLVVGQHVIPDTWLTPTVLAVAQGAYDERRRPCPTCHREAYIYNEYGGRMDCQTCQAQGWIDDGTLESDRLIILADALEEAGCEHEVLLRHLRGWEPDPDCVGHNRPDVKGWIQSTKPHVRGCWALDLLLGKE